MRRFWTLLAHSAVARGRGCEAQSGVRGELGLVRRENLMKIDIKLGTEL